MYEGVDIEIHVFLTSEVSGQIHASAALSRGKNPPVPIR
jgi:hypothetical protein